MFFVHYTVYLSLCLGAAALLLWAAGRLAEWLTGEDE